ncbi:hypothetical protein HY02_00375 [Peptococcaceae bacterium SCADC1_2_3]|jgi:wobble nucleotide-excising tRNase|nr:hypothetical protein DK28_0209845 [Peptococcaceae bacterium SCADC1_2_3]KFI34864.1 hypothetical protein HY00_08995 [Peptococcaceae bacterium SCADC1_2_3]KFI38366.1 hypothetical protein HY02_00375 [Peptococcaceae bacterium SCADC1_2_3]
MNKKALHDFTLRARKLLISEVEELLEAVYGLHNNGIFESIDHLPVISTDKNTKNTRAHLEKFLIDESKAGLRGHNAYEKLVKEIAFTWLNRFIAFKMMEVRRLIRQTITKGTDSNSFKLWLTQEGNEAILYLYEEGDSPKNAFGEGPRDIALPVLYFMAMFRDSKGNKSSF